MKEPKPIQFRESNHTYLAPEGLSNCGDLPCFKAPGQAISCWQFPLRDRIKFLFSGRMWFFCLQNSHPPVSLMVNSPFAQQKPEPAPKA